MKFKVKAIINFNDLEANTHRNVGDIFEVNERRKEYLLEHNAIEVIEKDEIKTIIYDDMTEEQKESFNKLKEIKQTEKAIEKRYTEKSNKNKKSSKK